MREPKPPQVLVTPTTYRRLAAEAKSRGCTVGKLLDEMIQNWLAGGARA